MKHKCYVKTPIGVICIEENGEAVTALKLDRECGGQYHVEKTNKEEAAAMPEKEGECPAMGFVEEPPTELLRDAGNQLMEYFQGKRKEFTLPLSPQGTKFRKKVWAALCTIPYGQTRSYGEIAAQIGNPRAARAVGGANNKNPIMIFIPCHRVVGADGSLTGFACGVGVKKYMLDLERASAAEKEFSFRD